MFSYMLIKRTYNVKYNRIALYDLAPRSGAPVGIRTQDPRLMVIDIGIEPTYVT